MALQGDQETYWGRFNSSRDNNLAFMTGTRTRTSQGFRSMFSLALIQRLNCT